MKQGRASVSGPHSRKIEPRSRAIHPGGVDAMGQHFGNHDMEEGTFKPNITPMDAGRGYSAPAIANTSRKAGSQGRY